MRTRTALIVMLTLTLAAAPPALPAAACAADAASVARAAEAHAAACCGGEACTSCEIDAPGREGAPLRPATPPPAPEGAGPWLAPAGLAAEGTVAAPVAAGIHEPHPAAGREGFASSPAERRLHLRHSVLID